MASPATRAISALDVVRQLWAQALLPGRVLENTVERGHVVLTGDAAEVGAAVRTSLQVGAVAQACCAAVALAERLRGSLLALERAEAVDAVVLERVEVDARHAVAEWAGWTAVHLGTSVDAVSADSDAARRALNIDEHAVADWDALAGLYRTAPSPARSVPGIVRIHTNFPHHKLGVLQLLGLVPASARWTDEDIHDIFARVGREDVQRELAKWDAFEFERAAQHAGLCATAYRSRAEWERSEMCAALRGWMDENPGGSAFRISRIECATPAPLAVTKRGEGKRLKVVDMSRVIAGPISTRTLAAHGADVLLLSSAHLPNLPLRELDTARGKRTAFVELPRRPSGLGTEMQALLKDADVFSQAYRPGGLAERGLGAEAVQQLRPGIVYAELCAFGFTGPWKHRRAYDSLTQTACGINFLEGLSYQQHHGTGGDAVEPKALPVQALDYAAGSLMCFATLACKCRAIMERLNGVEEEKGWKVQVSLASTAEWIVGLGQVHGDEAWVRPPAEVVPNGDEAGMARMTSSYRVRGLEEGDEDVRVLAIRHASIPPAQDEEDEGLRWTVPGHLGVDRLEWL
ncbi:conserved hypothetical protein [Sporisorium reilianum SRZ2]|uniref:CAIB/BAIF family enzyme n=1 Tax=Sporisorium reilianum (strain SRZ2) TaxID=999809 RepID=E6ZTG3_SPORE|nr:conserved hypothetical protein [Sporisorium reilianum SRZ2]